MKLFVRSALAALALAVAGTGALGAQQGPAVVWLDFDRIAEGSTVLQAAQRSLDVQMDALQAEAERELGQVSETFQRDAQTFQQQQATMSAERRQQQERELAQRQFELQQRGAVYERRAQAHRAEILGPAFERVQRQLVELTEELRRERGYAFILNRSGDGIVAADPALEITDEVLRRLNARATAGS
jgi:outer membrane protein